MRQRKTWLVTGASKGIGLTLAKQLLSQGYNVAATSRDIHSLETALGQKSRQLLPLAMDLTNEKDVAEKLQTAISHFGTVDVVVNNAGYGLMGGLEELTDTEGRANFEVNVFGMLNVIRNILPHLRANNNGHIFNISSIGGFNGGFPAFGIYCATKFAVSGLTESLFHEVKPFGIEVTLVMPGYFRTNFLSEGSIVKPQTEIEAYQNVRAVQKSHLDEINANQPGNPEKAAAALIAVANMKNPSLNLFLGPDAYQLAKDKIALIQADMATYERLATQTSFE
ncbi:SDR family oxidoreductase [Pedobacter xixiisoli]|uniref:Short-chain dehydrogenase n=1 Tax=Pedobacter xixiisoli TaxID=1476464 RepID=A0A286A098_9SPHI|nr:SDR family oxidoreductase [Pedobacter xixiisoli]SOD15332.1 Short-chain dehydrogenase [Pedobacter xixiisoli]